MTNCEICHDLFTPRPQTNKPRACGKRKCQHKRQRLNEKEWKSRNKDDYGAKYHAEQRKVRFRFLLALVERILKALQVGCTAVYEKFSVEEFKKILIPFFLHLGIRRANKLWRS